MRMKRKGCEMTRSSKAALAGAASQGFVTGFAGSADAVSVCDCTIAPQTPSSWKAHVVDLLSEVFEIEPARAIAWAHIVQARFLWFREA